MQTLATLPHDLYPLVFRGLTKRDLVVLSKVNRTLRQIALRYLYEPYFGRIDPLCKPDTKTLSSLLEFVGKEPHYFKDKAIDTTFTNVQETYNRRIALLEKTKPTSILHLKALQLGFYWTDRALTEYQKAKNIQQKEERIPLHIRCEGLSATIGKFRIREKSYEVVALHRYRDEHYPDNPKFGSLSDGQVTIAIRSGDPHLEHKCFNILISRNVRSCYCCELKYSSESTHDLHHMEVYDSLRRCEIVGHLGYNDSTTDPNGSDRLLDRKVTQIALEIMRNNNCTLQIPFHGDDVPVLGAAGLLYSFFQEEQETILRSFREDPNHKAFPPKFDYGENIFFVSLKGLQKKNVMFSRDKLESWEEIIAQEPILNPGAGVLPEFWAIPPHIFKD